MGTGLGLELYNRKEWPAIYQTVSEILKQGKEQYQHLFYPLSENEPPPILYLFHLLDLIDERALFEDLLTTIGQLEQPDDFKPWLTFLLAMQGKADQKTHQDPMSESLAFPPHLHPWLADGYATKRLEAKDAIGELTIDNYRSPEDIIASSPDWKWRQGFLVATIALRQSRWEQAMIFVQFLTDMAEEKLQTLQPVVYNLQGNVYLNQGRLDESCQMYYLALGEAWQYSNHMVSNRANNNIGLAYFHLGFYNEAERFLTNAIELVKDPNSKVLYVNNLAFTQLTQGKLKSSLHNYQRAQELLAHMPQSSSVEGYVKLGFGIHEASRGMIDQALPLFNQALERFVTFGNVNGQTYLHAIVGKAFFDNREFQLADFHFRTFVAMMVETQTFRLYFNYYAEFVLCLMDLGRRVEAKNHLIQLQMIAADNIGNRILRAWFSYVSGVYYLTDLDLPIAEELFYEVLTLTKDNGPFDLSLRTLITLCELFLRKYLLSGDESLIEKVQDLFDLADEVGSYHEIFPTIIFVKLYKAMLAAHKKGWKEARILIDQANQFIDQSGQTSLKIHLQTTAEQIESQRLLAGDFARGLVSSLRVGAGRLSRGVGNYRLDDSELGLLLWREAEFGPDLEGLELPNGLVPNRSFSSTALFLGTLYMTMLRQVDGEGRYEGLFGPLPVPLPNKRMNSLVSSKKVGENEDKSFYVLVFLYAGNYEFDRAELTEELKFWWSSLSKIRAEGAEQDLKRLKEAVLPHIWKGMSHHG